MIFTVGRFGFLLLLALLFGELSSTAGEPAFINSLGMHFVRIPADTFLMGSREPAKTVAANPAYGDEPGKAGWYHREHPLHRVTLTRPFLLQTTEVTVAQFRVFADDTGFRTDAEQEGWGWAYEKKTGQWVRKTGVNWRSPGFEQVETHPVCYVSWHDARAFINWINLREKTIRYRLPTEAEWEYACRAGSETPFFWGREPDGRFANFADSRYAAAHPKDTYVNRHPDDSRVHTAPVGSYRPNAFGLHDMSGNVNEWCRDWYSKYSGKKEMDPAGPENGEHRVLRGGSWCSIAAGMRSASRGRNSPRYRFSRTGFRLAWTY